MRSFSKVVFRYLLTIVSFIFSISIIAIVPASSSTTSLGVVVENGVIFPIVQNTELGRIVTTPCNTEIIHNGEQLLESVDIVLDPGHGGPETGSVGANGLVESDLNLPVTLLVEKDLTSRG